MPAKTKLQETYQNRMNPADLCRANGWGPGTWLAGDEGYGVTIIEITEVTNSRLFARTISHHGELRHERGDHSFILGCRRWSVVPQRPPAAD